MSLRYTLKFAVGFLFTVFFTLLVLLSDGCTSKNSQESSAAIEADKKVLHIYCWSNYFSPKFISEFEKSTGIKLDLNYFSSNEELMAKLQAGARGYDLIVPTGYLINALKNLNLIEPLGKIDWPELSTLSGRGKNPEHDPNYEYTIPYQMGSTGIAVNRAKLTTKVDSLSWIFEHPELKGQISMLDDAPSVIGAALKYLGYSYNEGSDQALQKAKELLKKQKPLLKTYSGDPMPIFESGEITIGQMYSGDAYQVRRKNPKVEFILPKEGGEFFVDYLAIPKGAKNIDGAKVFMRYSLNQKLAIEQAKHLFYIPAVGIAGVAEAAELLKLPAMNSSSDALKNFETLKDNPERLEKLQRIWTELKSS